MSDYIERYRVTVKWAVYPYEHKNQLALYEVAPQIDTIDVEAKSVFHVRQQALKVLREQKHDRATIASMTAERLKTVCNTNLDKQDLAVIESCAKHGNVAINAVYIDTIRHLNHIHVLELDPVERWYELTALGREIAAKLGYTGGAE